MVEVKRGIFGSMGNNCYLLTDVESGRSALVDCTEDSRKMREFVSEAKLDYILLTHGHFDHIGGVKTVAELTGAKVVISKEDEPMLSSSRKSLAAFCGASQNNTNGDILVDDNDVIKLGNTDIKVLATPGHTSGGVCYLADNELFTGDTLFCCSYGRTDFPTGDEATLSKSVKRLFSLEGNPNVYPGHDSVSTLDFERDNNIEAWHLINYYDTENK